MTKSQRVLVTGAAGFLGSAVVRALRSTGHEVLPTTLRARDGCASLDTTDAEALAKTLATYQPTTIVHLAGLRSEQLDQCTRTNTLTAALVLTAAERMRSIPGVVLVGTAEEYGTVRARPHREEDPCDPVSPYGISKNAATRLALSANARVPVCVLRPATLYGPQQPGFQLVSGVLAAALEDQVFRLHGGAAKRFRDLLYVDDAARAFVQAVTLVHSEARGRVFNISTGEPHSVRFVAERILSLVGRGRIEEGPPPPRAGDHDYLALDPSLARSVLQWTATTPLNDGLALTVQAALATTRPLPSRETR